MSSLTYKASNDNWCIFLTAREQKQYEHGSSFMAKRRKSGATWFTQRYAESVPNFPDREEYSNGPSFIKKTIDRFNTHEVIQPMNQTKDITFEKYARIRLCVINTYAVFYIIRILNG